jgi:hypothetical protein
MHRGETQSCRQIKPWFQWGRGLLFGRSQKCPENFWFWGSCGFSMLFKLDKKKLDVLISIFTNASYVHREIPFGMPCSRCPRKGSTVASSTQPHRPHMGLQTACIRLNQNLDSYRNVTVSTHQYVDRSGAWVFHLADVEFWIYRWNWEALSRPWQSLDHGSLRCG